MQHIERSEAKKTSLVIFVDVETQNFFSDPFSDVPLGQGDLKVSFVGVYDPDTDEFMSFWEKDTKKLEDVLVGADRVVGYNSWAFDYGVLSRYMHVDLWTLPSLDLMVAMKKAVGFRPKLDDLARANGLGEKIGKGADAIEYWQNGELDKLEEYCLEDVKLTYEVWRVGDKNRRLTYYAKSGFPRETRINWQDGFLERVDTSVQGVLL